MGLPCKDTLYISDHHGTFGEFCAVIHAHWLIYPRHGIQPRSLHVKRHPLQRLCICIMSLILRVGLSPPDILLDLEVILEIPGFDEKIWIEERVRICNEIGVQN